MPMDPGVTAAIIAAAANVTAAGTNATVQGKLNKKNRKWQDERYDRQRAHNLQDWNMTNEYNSPAAQMARLKAAGLNPNLIYGKMDNTSATTVNQAKYEPLPDKAPQIDTSQLGNSAMNIVAARNAAQANKNLEKQEKVIEAEARLKDAQTAATLAGTDMSRFDLKFKTDLLGTSTDMAKTALEKLRADVDQTKANTQFTLDSNERAHAMQQPTLQKAAQELINMRAGKSLTDAQRNKINAEINGVIENNRILKKQADLWESGVNPTAGALEKVLQQIYDSIFGKNSDTITEKILPKTDASEARKAYRKTGSQWQGNLF